VNLILPLANSLILQFLKPHFASMAPNTIVLDDNRIFHASEWIGIGKSYPTCNNEPYIEDAKKEVLSVPQQLQHDYFPSPVSLLVVTWKMLRWR
jgi:hypothetical protein